MRAFPPSFWNRGPAAWNLAQDATWIIEDLLEQPKHFLSLRSTTRYLRVSHKTLQRWEREGHLIRVNDGVHLKRYPVEHIIHFLQLLLKYQKDPPNEIKRIGKELHPFTILINAQFQWDRKEGNLTPSELAERIGCHPSTIIKAIYSYECSLKAIRKTPCRWEIKYQDWCWAFGETSTKKK